MKDNTEWFIQELQKIQSEDIELFKRKNKDYGDSFRDLGPIGILTRCMDKIKRAIQVLETDQLMVQEEAVRDTLNDLRIYTLMNEGLFREMKASNEDSNRTLGLIDISSVMLEDRVDNAIKDLIKLDEHEDTVLHRIKLWFYHQVMGDDETLDKEDLVWYEKTLQEVVQEKKRILATFLEPFPEPLQSYLKKRGEDVKRTIKDKQG